MANQSTMSATLDLHPLPESLEDDHDDNYDDDDHYYHHLGLRMVLK